MNPLIHIVYASRIRRPERDADQAGLLAGILETARRNNAAHDLTGMLLHAEGSFFQVLEGEKDGVRALYERIARDRAHSHVVKILDEPIGARAFAAWPMGFFAATHRQLAEIEGLAVFFTHKSSLTELGANRATVLLNAFIAGRYPLT